ncbi:MAG: hypothetical protein ACK5H1_04515 [Tenacibaculum sp.]
MQAQRNSASPYSYFGIGESFESLTVEQVSMGGIGVALKDNYHLNFTNPAANADLVYTTYGLGGSVSFITLKETNNSQSGNSTALRYIALGLPVVKKIGVTIGLQPFSSVGYALLNRQFSDTETNEITEITRFTGSGGTNKLYAGIGAYVFKGLSVGVEASFIFGNIENNVLNQIANISLATKHNENLNIKGTQFKLGGQHKIILKNKLQINTGAVATLKSNLSAVGTQQQYSLSFDGSGLEQIRDTLFDNNISGKITLPYKVAFGLGLGKKNKWYISANQEYKQALAISDEINLTSEGFSYESANKFSLGGFYIPKFNSISSYWNRVTYRAGLRFENIGVLVEYDKSLNNVKSISDFGINFGFGLPLPKSLSNINLGFEYGQRGTTNNNLIKENYFNVKLSLSLNSLDWFIKRKID